MHALSAVGSLRPVAPPGGHDIGRAAVSGNGYKGEERKGVELFHSGTFCLFSIWIPFVIDKGRTMPGLKNGIAGKYSPYNDRQSCYMIKNQSFTNDKIIFTLSGRNEVAGLKKP